MAGCEKSGVAAGTSSGLVHPDWPATRSPSSQRRGAPAASAFPGPEAEGGAHPDRSFRSPAAASVVVEAVGLSGLLERQTSRFRRKRAVFCIAASAPTGRCSSMFRRDELEDRPFHGTRRQDQAGRITGSLKLSSRASPSPSSHRHGTHDRQSGYKVEGLGFNFQGRPAGG